MPKFDVVVMGSINLDVKVLLAKYPEYRHTATAQSIDLIPGGKGANQAIACAKLGAQTAFIGAVGLDSAGKQMLKNLENHQIDTQYIQQSWTTGTGTFVVMVDTAGENTMVGMLGANDDLDVSKVEATLANVTAPVFLLQMETSQPSVLTALKQAKQAGMFVILDPAPADNYFEEALQYADCVTPNEQETERITGIKVTTIAQAKEAAQIIAAKGVPNVIVKLGRAGSVVYRNGVSTVITPYQVQAVDTVGAGDTFAGALAVEYGRTGAFLAAVEFANKAAALKVSRAGGQAAMPTRKEVLTTKLSK